VHGVLLAPNIAKIFHFNILSHLLANTPLLFAVLQPCLFSLLHTNISSFFTIHPPVTSHARANIAAVRPRCKVSSQENRRRKCPCSGPTFCITLPQQIDIRNTCSRHCLEQFSVALYHTVRSSHSTSYCWTSHLNFAFHSHSRSRTINSALVNLEIAEIAIPPYRPTDSSPKPSPDC